MYRTGGTEKLSGLCPKGTGGRADQAKNPGQDQGPVYLPGGGGHCEFRGYSGHFGIFGTDGAGSLSELLLHRYFRYWSGRGAFPLHSSRDRQ